MEITIEALKAMHREMILPLASEIVRKDQHIPMAHVFTDDQHYIVALSELFANEEGKQMVQPLFAKFVEDGARSITIIVEAYVRRVDTHEEGVLMDQWRQANPDKGISDCPYGRCRDALVVSSACAEGTQFDAWEIVPTDSGRIIGESFPLEGGKIQSRFFEDLPWQR